MVDCMSNSTLFSSMCFLVSSQSYLEFSVRGFQLVPPLNFTRTELFDLFLNFGSKDRRNLTK